LMEAFVFPVLALIAGLLLDATNERIRFLHIPNTILIFMFSLFVRYVFISSSQMLILHSILHAFLPLSLIEIVNKNYTWKTMDAEHIVQILLPPMIFESAFKINSHLFFRKLKLLFALTTFVYISTMVTYAAFTFPILRITDDCSIFTNPLTAIEMLIALSGRSKFSRDSGSLFFQRRSQVLMLSSILAATDPIAVVAILEEIGAPQRLRIIIEGESLLNDGLSIFAYSICASYVKAESKQELPDEKWYHLAFMCANCIILSPLIGILFAQFVVRVIRIAIRDNKKIQVFLVVTVYIMWFLGEYINGSPAVLIVFYGVMLNYMREELEPSTVEMALQMWASFGYWANCVIFTFGGYSIGSLLFKSVILKMNVTHLLISGILLYPFSVVARMLAIAVFKYLWESVETQHRLYDSDCVLLAYGGLKGALALLLAHDFTRTVQGDIVCERIGQKVVLYCSAAVSLCLLIQGMTFSLLTKREGTNHRSRFIKDSEKNLENHLNNELRIEMEKMHRRSELYLTEANWKVVNERIEANVFKGFTLGLGSQSRVQTSEECSAHTETLEELNKNEENRDICAGYYSILLARVNDMWARGALSGSAAHIMIQLLEHGIDEEKLDLDDFKEHLHISKLNCFQRFLLKLFSFIEKWIDKDTLLNRFCQWSDPFLKETMPRDVTVVQPLRDKERWLLFSALICVIHSVLLTFALYHKMESHLRYSVLVVTFFILMVFLIEELFYFHRFRKPLHRMELSRYGMRCFWFISRFAAEMCYCAVCGALILGVTITITLLLTKHSNGDCVSLMATWNVTPICAFARITAFLFHTALCVLKLIRATPLLVFILYEAVYVQSLLRVRVELSALYSLQYLLSQPPVTFHLFPDNAFKVALVEQKYLNKIVDALIRKTMKKNKQILDLVPSIKTRQAIRMASHALHNTVVSLNSQGLIHEESMLVWERSLKRLRDDGDRLILAPDTDIHDVLECVHWIESLDVRKRPSIINKIADYFETAVSLFLPYDHQIHTYGSKMFFIRKGICRITETSSTAIGSVHRHEYYVHQGRFIGERNLLKNKNFKEESIKKPQVVYQTTTDCHLIEVDESMMEWIRNADRDIIRIISTKEQRRRIVYELKEHNQLFSLMTIEDFDKLFKLCARFIKSQERLEIDAGKKLFVGWRTLVCSVEPLSAFNDHYQVIGPASVLLRPVGVDDGMVLLTDNVHSSDQATSDEPESNLSLSLNDSEIKKAPKKVDVKRATIEQSKQVNILILSCRSTHVSCKLESLKKITQYELNADVTQYDSSQSSRRTQKMAVTQSELRNTEKTLQTETVQKTDATVVDTATKASVVVTLIQKHSPRTSRLHSLISQLKQVSDETQMINDERKQPKSSKPLSEVDRDDELRTASSKRSNASEAKVELSASDGAHLVTSTPIQSQSISATQSPHPPK
uniref:Na_H_Exchanger domain-containing protein n=1 Tax=Anisakis simplex TaxID=6269 RepID=A0A158PNK9_ANISI